MNILLDTFKDSLQIALFVLSMMLIIEYFTVQTKNKIIHNVSKNIWFQVVLAAFLGIIPGCLGTFLVVSLYAHEALNFASLVSVMIATSGDEAFVMFSKIPETAIKLNIAIFIVAIITGFILNMIFGDKTLIKLKENHLRFHENEISCVCFDKKLFFSQLKHITFERFLLILISFLFFLAILTAQLGPSKWNYIRVILLLISIFILFISVSVPDHFLTKHLWEHTIKQHLGRIFIWTFGTLLFINIILPYLGLTQEKLQSISGDYFWLLLIIAILVGIIPESGPHLVFIFLFSQGIIPFSILLANSIVQDGHGSLPLLAESQKSFLYVKIINLLVGFVIGAGFHLIFNM